MANTYKNIVITPNIGNTADPRIQFSGGNTTANTDVNLYVYPSSNGTLSFEGSAGQLFSITNDLSNLIFSVADVSGIPSLEIYANGLVSVAPLGGNVVIGSTSELVISSGAGIFANGSLGTAGHTLHSNGSSVYWADDDQGVTSVTAGTGLSGGTITGTGTLSAVAGTGTVVNTTGIHVNASYIGTIAPTLTGTGASGTWSINVTGTAYGKTEGNLNVNNASYAFNYTQGFNSNWNTDFAAAPAGSMILRGDTSSGSATGGPGGSWWFQQNFRHTNSSNLWGTQIAWGWEDNANILRTRNVQGGNYGAWVTYLNSSNFNSYSPTLTGTGASGTWSINVTGTAYSKAESALNVNSALTANNSTNLGGSSAASYQTTAGLSANVATLTANNATNLGGFAATTYDRFPAGTVMLFVQTAAPTGWTKSTTHDNKALRIVSGSVSSGGSVAFTTAFASQSVSGTIANTTAAGTIANTVAGGAVGNHTLDATQIPAHTHYIAAATTSSTTTVANTTAQVNRSRDISTNSPNYILTATTTAATVGLTSSTGNGAAHNHTFTGTTHGHTFTGTTHGHTFTGTAINLAVSYVDAIIATKN